MAGFIVGSAYMGFHGYNDIEEALLEGCLIRGPFRYTGQVAVKLRGKPEGRGLVLLNAGSCGFPHKPTDSGLP